MKNLKYNYVYFNTSYLTRGRIDPNEYNAICLRDATHLSGVKVVSTPLEHFPYFFRLLYRMYHTRCINKYVSLPFKKLWHPFVFKNDFKDAKPFCFVVSCNSLPIDYFYYLKKKYPTCKLVKLHRDLLKVTYENPEYSESNMRKIFDFRMTIDQNEAEKYGLLHFHEIESKIDLVQSKNYPLFDVFFAGKAKDRLPKLLEAYDMFSQAGLKCFFYITNARPDQMEKREGIVYSEKLMPYLDMLKYSINSRCMFDINQEGALGFTSRFLEAVMYNKLLITDNPSVLDSKYYKSDYIQYFDDVSKIDVAFINDKKNVNYNYAGDFSPIHLIERIDEELVKRYGAPQGC